MVRLVRVGMAPDADIRISDIDPHAQGSDFTLTGGAESPIELKAERFTVPMVGEFNVRNAAMALCAARFAGLDAEQLRRSLLRFEGVMRRQEVRGTVNDVTVVDDFAHHPTAITQSIAGLRQRFPKSRLWVLFEPRSNTTIRNLFQHELAEALSHADFPVVAHVVSHVHPGDVLLVMSNGGFGGIHNKLLAALAQ